MASDIAKAYVQIVPTSQGLGGKLQSMLDGEVESVGKSSGNKLGSFLGNGLATGLKVGGTALAAASVAIGKFTADAVSSYASYEQLVGGVEKLYGDAAGQLEDFANKAYLTSGMSANAYMETATSFSAALINSLGGDQQKAAEMTDVAMRAISDNVNVFGSDMESVTNAFQGFAKGNYTMLDNLKLGYGGTKEEMERLIADANEYRASIGESADLSKDSFADIVQAIQSVQEAQGIAGTTNAEAMKTIEGSATAVKAAWENVVTTIASGEGLGDSVNGLVTSLFGENEGEGLINQIVPRVEEALKGIAEFIGTAAPIFIEKIPPLITEVLPSLIESGMILLQALIDGVLTLLPELVPLALDIVMQLADAILTNLPAIIETGLQVIVQLALGIAQALPTLIPTIVEVVLNIAEMLIDNIDMVIDAAIQLIIGLAMGLIEAIPIIIEKAPIIIGKLAMAIIDNLPKILEAGVQLIVVLGKGLMQALSSLLSVGRQILSNLINVFSSSVQSFMNIGHNIVQGIRNGIANAWNNLVSWFKGLFGDLIGVAKRILGIASPSKVFEKIGEQTTEGFNIGMADFGQEAITDVQNAMDEISGMSATVDALNSSSQITTDITATMAARPDTTATIEALLAQYLPMLENGTNVNVSLEGDAQGLFNAVRKETNLFTKSTGKSPFAIV